MFQRITKEMDFKCRDVFDSPVLYLKVLSQHGPVLCAYTVTYGGLCGLDRLGGRYELCFSVIDNTELMALKDYKSLLPFLREGEVCRMFKGSDKVKCIGFWDIFTRTLNSFALCNIVGIAECMHIAFCLKLAFCPSSSNVLGDIYVKSSLLLSIKSPNIQSLKKPQSWDYWSNIDAKG